MTDFDDLQLGPTGGKAPPSLTERPARFPVWVLITAGALLGALLGFYYLALPGTPRDAAPASTANTAVDIASKPVPLRAEPGEAIDLPPLDQTDTVVRTLVGRLSSHPQIAAWLATDGLIRNMTVAVTGIAGGQSPAKQLQALRPSGAFTVRESGNEVWLNPASYGRYDSLAAAVEGVDARGVARFYATVRPRIDDAYRELGVGEQNFDPVVKGAIVMLLRTPIVDGNVRLRPGSVTYAYADPALEGLTKAQRQFLRMGPRNMRIVKAKLREVARYLGIPDADLPPPDPQ